MRYSEEHKAETHQRLLGVASAALRKSGPDGLSVAETMRAAGLTHGGFYAHFKSKDALLTETLAYVFAEMSVLWDRRTAGLAPRAALEKFIDQYVSERHRDHPADGCPVVALNSDLPRQSKKFRSAFDKGVKAMQIRLSARLEAAGVQDHDTLAPALLAIMVGAVALSRTLSDKAQSDELLATTRETIKSRLLS